MRVARRVRDELRELARFAPVRPAVASGVRAALATVLPLVLGAVLGVPGVEWASLAGFLVALSDRGGAYRARAATMGVLTLTGALAGVVGGLAGGYPGLAIPLLSLWVTACGMARVYGASATLVGNSTATGFVISLATPAAGLGDALGRGVPLLLGGLWATALALLLWPIRIYRPARLAVAHGYRVLADHAGALARAAARAEGADWQPLLREHAGIREALEEARAVLAYTRRGRPGESGRGERLLVLLEVADQLFGTVVALTDVLEGALRDPAMQPARAPVVAAVGEFASVAREIARLVETEEEGGEVHAPTWDAEDAVAAAEARGVARLPHYRDTVSLLATLWEYADTAVETAAGLDDERAAPGIEGAARAPAEPRRPLLQPLRENLTPGSLVTRHALRMGVAAGVALWLTHLLRLERGYWLILTVILILQPYSGATWDRGLQRILGTVLGGMLTALLAAAVHTPVWIMALVFVFSGASVAVLPLNYALFSVLLTPAFVLLAELHAGDWHLAGVRIVNTLLGGALAILAVRLLWPVPERVRFPELLAVALRANRDYLRMAVALVAGGSREPPGALVEARRRAGLSTLNAEASFQRVLGESRGRPERVEPLMTILVCLRRLTAAETQLATPFLGAGEPLRPFEAAAGGVLEDLAEAVAAGRPPAPIPALPVDRAALDPVLLPRVERVVRQLTVLHAAVARLSRGEAEAPRAVPDPTPAPLPEER